MQEDTTSGPRPREESLELENPKFEMIPHWVLFHPDASPNAIRMYLVLRSYADKAGRAFPSRATLARRMNVSVPTVDVAKMTLVDIGALKVERRMSNSGDPTSNLYVLVWGSKEIQATAVKKSGPGGVENKGSNLDLPKPNLPNLDNKGFDQFWAVYPRKHARVVAKKAWDSAIKKAKPEVIVEAAARYRDDPNRDDAYTAHAATWLNQERWADAPLPARRHEGTGGEKRMNQYEHLYHQLSNNGREIES